MIPHRKIPNEMSSKFNYPSTGSEDKILFITEKASNSLNTIISTRTQPLPKGLDHLGMKNETQWITSGRRSTRRGPPPPIVTYRPVFNDWKSHCYWVRFSCRSHSSVCRSFATTSWQSHTAVSHRSDHPLTGQYTEYTRTGQLVGGCRIVCCSLLTLSLLNLEMW